MLPQVRLDDKLFEALCKPWRDALVIKLLGKFVGYRVLHERLQRLWKPSGGFDILDVDNGYYMVKFDLQADKDLVMSGGPWMLFDHYLCVSHRSSEFASPNANVQRTMVWVRFPRLNLLYYDENVLLGLASIIGKPIRVDKNTLSVERGRFSRACVKIDLSKPVVGKIWLRDHWYRVEYEGLHLICAKCGCYGHLARDCSSPIPPPLQDTSADKALGATPSSPGLSDLPNDQDKIVPQPVEQPLTLTPTVSHGAAGVVYDLSKDTHGEWLTVTRRKRPVRDPAKEAFEGLKNSIQRSNRAIGENHGTSPSDGPRRDIKNGAKQKRRRQDNPPQPTRIPIPLPQDQATGSKSLNKDKDPMGSEAIKMIPTPRPAQHVPRSVPTPTSPILTPLNIPLHATHTSTIAGSSSSEGLSGAARQARIDVIGDDVAMDTKASHPT